MFKLFPATITYDGRKVPVKNFKWQEDCTDNQDIINSWTQLYPQLKYYGIPTGPINGIIALDIDVKNDGLKTIKKYHVPLTLSQQTPSGGIHYLFKYPNDGNTYGNKVGVDRGMDVRAAKGYILHYGLDNIPIVEAPLWLLEACLKKTKVTNSEQIVKASPDVINQVINEACENIRNAPEGERNNILNVETYKVGQYNIERNICYDRLFEAAKDTGIEDYEAQATINSGLEGGGSNPNTCPFPNTEPILTIPQLESKPNDRWTPSFFTSYDLKNTSKLRKPQLFEDWSTEDINLTTADGGTGKTTIKLYEAVCLALGEDFLGFKCMGEGRTLYITGEDTKEKLGAMIGMIIKQMGIMDDTSKVEKVLNSILVKLDSELCVITKSKQGFITINQEGLNKVMEAVEDIRPKMIVFDPISSFWGSEAALNDMSRAVTKFMGALVKKSNACVEIINHQGKQSSSNKDMTQFAGRGGTGLPSHSRVSKVLRPVFDEEFTELTGMELDENKAAMMCNVNKFSDGSPLYNKPFLIVREGYLFSKLELVEQKVKEEQNKMSNVERIFTFVKTERNQGRYPTKNVIIATFMESLEKISKDKINGALSTLTYTGHMGEMLKLIENPDIEAGGKVYIITDMKGKEL